MHSWSNRGSTSLVELSNLGEKILENGIVFDTPSGRVNARTNFSNGKFESVTVGNVSSFFIREETISLRNYWRIAISFAFGGNFYAYVNAKELGLRVRPKSYCLC